MCVNVHVCIVPVMGFDSLICSLCGAVGIKKQLTLEVGPGSDIPPDPLNQGYRKLNRFFQQLILYLFILACFVEQTDLLQQLPLQGQLQLHTLKLAINPPSSTVAR